MKKALIALSLSLAVSLSAYADHEAITNLGDYSILSNAHSTATTISASGNASGLGLGEYGGAYLELFPSSTSDGSYANNGTGSLDIAGRTLEMGVQDMGNGVTMQRKAYVPLDGSFIRWINTIINTSDTDATAILGIEGLLTGASSVDDSSNTDAIADVADYWVNTYDGSSLYVEHVLNGSGVIDDLSYISFVGNSVGWGYNLTLPAGQTVVVMHYAAANTDGVDAVTQAMDLADGSASGALDYMTPAEFSQLYSEYPATRSLSGGSSSSCFIATAAYGTPMAQEIDTLRAVRDTYMLNNILGTAFVDTYYRLSPPIADKVAAHPVLASAVRVALTPFVLLGKLILAAPMVLLTTLLVGAGLVLSRRRGTGHQS